jgi:VanZ family protein
MNSWRYLFPRGAATLWLAVLTWGSLAPQESVRGAFTFGDVLVHIAGYLGLTLLLLASQRQPRLLVTGAVSVTIGVLMEILQLLTSDRSGSLADIAANAAGAVIAVVIWRIGARITS